MKNFRRWIGTTIIVAMAAGLTLLPPKLHSQQQVEATAAVSYEGQRVSSVQLAGQPDGNARKLQDMIAQPINAPYSQAKVDETATALVKAGAAKDVEVQTTPAPEGLHVLFVLKPAYYFGVYTFPKAEKVFSYTRLLQASNYSKQEPFAQEKVEEAESSLLEFFHRTGFFMATVEPKLQTDEKHRVVNVEYDINLKRRAKFGEVILTGVSEEQTRKLNASLRSIKARIKGAYIKPGKPYRLKKLTAATAFLQQQLGNQHFLAGRVKLVSTLYNPETNRTDIRYNITDGPKIEIKLTGAHVWGRTQKKLIPMYQENTVDPDLVNEGAQDLTSYFQAKGFFEAKVQSHIQRDASGGVTVLYQISKGPRGKVESIDFHGNEHFSDKDLKAHVSLSKRMPLNPFSHGKYSEQLVRKSVKNIEGLYHGAGYSQVQVTPKVVNKDNELQIAFQVVEGVRDVVDSLQIEGNKALTEQELAPKGMNLEPGKPYSTLLLTKDRDQIMATYLDKGFLNVTFKSKVDHTKDDPHHVQVVYQIEEGPQVRTASVEPVGAQ
ncbi:MAG TPA: POTRA domain-containing protein, partial [Candidatus Angelobacter sp.]|nr:POTRA domain-containing protein [Candidatus Angelobacter sp.]